MYRTIDAKFWTDPKVRKLPKDGKLLLLYLITNPHTHLCGFYYLPGVMAAVETGITEQGIDTLFESLTRLEIALRDPENHVVWIINMFQYQGRGQKNESAATKQLEVLVHSPLVAKFLDRYPRVKIPLGYPIQTKSGAATPEQEQEQEQEQELKPGAREEKPAEKREPKSKPADATSIDLPPVLNNQAFRDAFALWLAFKKERRESYLPAGMAGVISTATARANAHGVQSVIDAMETARANGWQGWNQTSLFGDSNGTRRQTARPSHRHRG